MKKIIVLFTIIISFFVFNISFQAVSQISYRKERSIGFNLAYQTELKATISEFKVAEKEKDNFLKEMNEFLEKNNYIAYISVRENLSNFNIKEDYYLFLQNKEIIKSLYCIREGKNIDFSKSENQYYTTDLNDERSRYHINYLNNDYNQAQYDIINIFPFKSYSKCIDFKKRTIFYVNFFVKDINNFNDKLQNSLLNKYIDEYKPGPMHSTLDESIEVSLSYKMLTIIALSLLLVSICYVFRVRQEIIIRKMHGMSSFYILKKLFLKPSLLLLSAYFFIQVICYGIWIGNFYSNSIEFAFIMVQYFLYFIFVLMIAMVILYLIICYWVNVNYLKREKENRKLIAFNIVLKVVAVMLLIQPTINELGMLVNNTKLYFLLNSDRDIFSNSIYLSGIAGDSNEEVLERQQLVFDYFDKNGGFYQNFDSYYLSKNNELPEEFNMGSYPIPYLEASVNYLKKYNLIDNNHHKINYNQLAEGALLVPIKYKNQDLSLYEGDPIVYIENGIEFKRETIREDYQAYYLADPIIKIYRKTPLDAKIGGSFTTVLPINNEDDIKAFSQYLKANHLENKVNFQHNKNDYKVILSSIRDKVTKGWFMISIQIMVILLFLFETVYFIILQEQKKYVLRYIQGSTFIERYATLYLMNFAVYLIVSISGLLMHIKWITLLQFVLFLLIFESVITYVIIKRFEKKSAIACLKGE